LPGGELCRKIQLECGVLPRNVGVVPEVVAKCECACLLVTAECHDVDVMCIRPRARSVEEWAESIVFVGNMNEPESVKGKSELLHRLERANGDLNIDDGLGGHARNGSGAMMLDSSRYRP